MLRAINTSVRIFSEVFQPQSRVLEIGSFYLPGYEDLCNLRRHFPGREYIGCDIRPGLGVDRIEDAQQLSFSDESLGTVLLFETLEHMPHPDRAIREAHRVLRKDGLLALSVPFSYRLHGFPADYWRFTASGIHTLLSEFPQKVVFALGPRVKPSFTFAVAAREAHDGFADKKARFQAEVCKTFRASRLEGLVSALKERSRDLLGLLLGRADLSVQFFDPSHDEGKLWRSSLSDEAAGRNRANEPDAVRQRNS